MTRPANVVTSVADVLAGTAIAGAFSIDSTNDPVQRILALCLSTACLYSGGIVFNDVFDADLDTVERPERAIPSGLISVRQATVFGSALLLAGILAAGLAGITSALLAAAISFFALLYNKIAKHHAFFGPLAMGICRGLNLLLGVSIVTEAQPQWYFLAIVPVLYIFSITLISRGEVHGDSSKKNLYIGGLLYTIVAGLILFFSYRNEKAYLSAVILLPFLWMIFTPLIKAIQNPVGKNIGAAVKAGVISLILMDAAWAATFSTLYTALVIACLLPLSLWLAKIFAVT